VEDSQKRMDYYSRAVGYLCLHEGMKKDRYTCIPRQRTWVDGENGTEMTPFLSARDDIRLPVPSLWYVLQFDIR